MGSFLPRVPVVGAGVAAAILTCTLLTAPPPASGAFPGEAGLIVYSADGEIFVVAPTPEAEPVQLTDDEAADTQPSWSPDGRRIVFVSTREGGSPDIWSMDADGTDLTRLTENSRYDSEPVFSPDGTRIAFTSTHPDFHFLTVWTMESDGDNPVATSMTPPADPGDPYPGRGEDEGASWSPDGATIAFASARAGDRDIWLMSADGAVHRPVAIRTGVEMRPDWAPDGSRLVIETRSTDSRLTLMELDGTLSPLETGTSAASPSWSPEGDRIVYEGAQGLTIIGADGGTPVPLGIAGQSPDWQPLPPPRADLQVRRAGQRGWTGDDVYTLAKQQVTVREDRGDTVSVSLRVQNDGRAPDGYLVEGDSGKRGYKVEYLHRGELVTGQVLAGDYEVAELAPGGRSDVLTIEVTLGRKAAPGSSLEMVVNARPSDAAKPVDKIGVTVARR